MTTATSALHGSLVERVLRGYRTDAHVRLRLPGGGQLNLDRKLPFIFVYRQPAGRDDTGTYQLLVGEASYLLALGEEDRVVTRLVRALADVGREELGSFLVVELWTGDDPAGDFIVHAPSGPAPTLVEAFRDGLGGLPAAGVRRGLRIMSGEDRHPPGLPPLMTQEEAWQTGCLIIGIEVPPVFRGEAGVYPVFLRRLRTLLSGVLRRAAYEFARVHTTAGLGSYRALGPRTFGDALIRIDRELADIERSYEFLLAMAPVNSDTAWYEFEAGAFRQAPEFHYRLLPVDPDLLKRRLYALDLDEVADPAMAFLLRDKRDELDRQVTMLAERNTPTFRLASMRLYGTVDDVLLRVAREILRDVPPPVRTGARRTLVRAAEFARLATAEMERYRQVLPDMNVDVQLRRDVVGLMVSRGRLFVDERLRLPPGRVEPLLQHEVGTHVLTYFNGRAQPLLQLSTGLADYDELQEGLAVFTEYLAGGLSPARMRTLAARVIAAHTVEQGATFVETFRVLVEEHGFTRGTAFDIAERVHQAGGFTRDLIYLRGLLHVLEFVRAGGDVAPLFIGKIAAKHIEILEELRARGFLRPAPLVPAILERASTAARLAAVRDGLRLINMISEVP